MIKATRKLLANVKESYNKDKLGFVLLSLVYVFIAFSIFSIPVFTYREEYTFITNVLCALASLVIVLYLFFRGRFYINYYILCLLLFLFYALGLTLLTTKSFGLPRLSSLFTLYGYVFCLIEFWFNRKSSKYFVTMVCLSSLLFTILFVLTYYENIVNMDFDQRFGDDFGNVNTICSIFVFGIMFLTYSALTIKKWGLLLFIPIVVMVFCALITGSRWGLVALVVGFILLFYEMAGRFHKIEFAGGAIALVIIFIILLQLPVFAEYKKHFTSLFDFFSNNTNKRGSTAARTAMFFDGLKLWLRNIFIGYGSDGFKANTSYGMYSHSTVIELLTNFGLIGFCLFYVPLIRMIVNSYKIKDSSQFKLLRSFCILLIIYSVFAVCHNSKYGILCLSFFIGIDFCENRSKQFYYSLSFFKDKEFSVSSTIHAPEAIEQPQPKQKKKKSKFRIAFVISALYKGGAERVASILANKWTEKGYEVAFFITSPLTKNRYPIDERIKVVDITVGVKFKFLPSFKVNSLVAALEEYQPDVITSFLTTPNYYASCAAKRLKVPFICSERSDPSRTTNLIYKMMRKSTFNNADHIVFQGEYARDFFPKAIKKKSSIINNPCVVSETKNPRKEKVIISAGRLEQLKGFDVLIKAFSRIKDLYPDYKLRIFGEGSERKNLQSLIEQMNLNERVELLPFTDKIHLEMKRSSLYVLSSRYEGMPNTLCESLLLGLPCVATNCPIGLSPILVENNVNGLICETDNSSDLALAMSYIITSLKRFEKAALDKVPYYSDLLSPDKISEQWLALMKNAIKQHGEKDE